MHYSAEEIARFTQLYSGNIIPLRVVLASFTWVLYDYFNTLEEEVRYIWPQKRSLGKLSYLFIRYYTILLLLFDVVQIHSFAIPGVTSNAVCVAMDPTVRIVGAISLWSIEIIMQVRVYALYGCSRKIAIFNAVVFALSIIAFLVLLVHNTMARAQMIASAIKLPLPGCPAINGGLGWALWLPATGFELLLFAFAVYKSIRSLTFKAKLQEKWTLMGVLIGDNILYFVGITSVLLFNTVMASGASKVIPWFSYGPFHAAMGIMTTHMLMHLRKLSVQNEFFSEILPGDEENGPLESPNFAVPSTAEVSVSRTLAGEPSQNIAGTSSSADRRVDLDRDLESQVGYPAER
ncbi:hypothetical protein D9611_001401 [Ephemerocybe angulata]|uniref:DUF6533 domain-containing protein n=1 Tax=Ephemerocybe angulata TaxID=980116 RepID=A0A8H5CIV3_9AGAR|nr:hypothetical protein D9611_001401 [Tulosesus angulatus]